MRKREGRDSSTTDRMIPGTTLLGSVRRRGDPRYNARVPTDHVLFESPVQIARDSDVGDPATARLVAPVHRVDARRTVNVADRLDLSNHERDRTTS